MFQNNLIKDFEECIYPGPRSPDNYKIEDYLVIYPVDTNYTEEYIINGYLKASEKIIFSIKSKADDALALPLLGLYFNTFEFALKLLKKTLNEHKTCNVIKKSNQGSTTHHDLLELIKNISLLLPGKTKLHFFAKFDKIKDLISEFYNYDITSESTRFCYDKENKELKLHKKQTYIIYKELHHNVKEIIKAILDYINNDDFRLCATNEFTQQKLEELKYVKNVMEENKSLIQEAKQIKFTKIKVEILPAIVMGLYFTNSPVTIQNLKNFEHYPLKELKAKIIERCHLYEEAYRNLLKHIAYIENIIETKL